MRFQHLAVFVSDLSEAIHLWRGIISFEIAIETVISDDIGPSPTTYLYPNMGASR